MSNAVFFPQNITLKGMQQGNTRTKDTMCTPMWFVFFLLERAVQDNMETGKKPDLAPARDEMMKLQHLSGILLYSRQGPTKIFLSFLHFYSQNSYQIISYAIYRCRVEKPKSMLPRSLEASEASASLPPSIVPGTQCTWVQHQVTKKGDWKGDKLVLSLIHFNSPIFLKSLTDLMLIGACCL